MRFEISEAPLSCRALTLEVPGRVLCSDFSFDVRRGECWAVVGPNGAGKTTLLATLAGLRAFERGDIAYSGSPVATLSARELARRRGWLPQDSVDFFPATVIETVLVGRHPHLSRWQWESSSDIDCANKALADVGLAGFARRQVASLSGGERRRVALAALLTQDPEILLLDEPSSHLDIAHQVAMLDLIARLARERGKTIIMVLHDMHLALRYADHAIALGSGQALADAAESILTAESLSALFGHPLVAIGGGNTRTIVPA